MTASDTVFKMLSFQYKPLEKRVLKDLWLIGRDDLVKTYKKFTSSQKIAYLDRVARRLAL
jgi:hypothetical protein